MTFMRMPQDVVLALPYWQFLDLTEEALTRAERQGKQKG